LGAIGKPENASATIDKIRLIRTYSLTFAADCLHVSHTFRCGHSADTDTVAIKLTDYIVRRLPAPAKGNKIYYDTDVKGYGCRVTAAGARSFILNYRARNRREHRTTIGSFPEWGSVAARKEAAELKKTIDRGANPVGELRAYREAPTVNDLCDRFLVEYLPRKRPSTQHSYRLQIENEIRPALGQLKVADVTFADTDGLHRKLTGRGTPYRANRVIALLSRMFSMAMRWQWRSDNPCKGIERNAEHKRRRYLTNDELMRLGKALDKYSDRQSANIIGLLLLTGARRGEALAARWADFDAGFHTWTKPGATTKQKTEHSVPLNGAARELLVKIRRKVPAGIEWVFPANGSHRRDVKDAWATICRMAKIDGLRTHDLRHCFASVLVSAGYSLPTIGALLGHVTAQTTHRYTHLADNPLRLATEKAGAIIGGRKRR
jgi:integrase